MTTEPLVTQVLIGREAPEREAAELESALARHGIEAGVRRALEGSARSVEITLAEPIAAFLETFGSTFGRTPARDGLQLVEEWVDDLAAVWDGSVSIGIKDPDGTLLVLSNRLPSAAFAALADLDWSSLRGSSLTWDERDRRWTAAPS